MHHPEFSSQIARERRARYFADAGRRRLARPDRSARRRIRRGPGRRRARLRPIYGSGTRSEITASDPDPPGTSEGDAVDADEVTAAAIPPRPSTISTTAGTTPTSTPKAPSACSANTTAEAGEQQTAHERDDVELVALHRATSTVVLATAPCDRWRLARDLDRAEPDVRVDEDAGARRRRRDRRRRRCRAWVPPTSGRPRMSTEPMSERALTSTRGIGGHEDLDEADRVGEHDTMRLCRRDVVSRRSSSRCPIARW